MAQKIEAIEVKLEMLRVVSKTSDNKLYFDSNRFLIKDGTVISPETINTLLKILPLMVINEGRGKYQVVFGSRLFNIAAQTLKPSDLIPAQVIPKNEKCYIDQLIYLDLAVFPLLESLSLSAPEQFDLINIPEFMSGAWEIESKAAFADMLGVSRSVLSTKPRTKKSASDNEN